MSNKMKGSMISSGHQAVTRGILRDADVDVLSRGGDFYNQNDFPLLYWLHAFGEWFEKNQPSRITRSDIDSIWRQAKNKLSGVNRIVIAQTPAEVEKEYLDRLDGGILHEAFHSIFTLTGKDLDLDKVEHIMDTHFDADVPYGKKLSLLQKLNNIFEDAFIERLGIKQFRGGLSKIQKVHELIWEKEAEVRQHRPMGEQFINKEGQRVTAMKPIGHMTCYLRDRCEYYLNDAPVDEYDEDIRRIVDSKFAGIIRDSKHAKDSYDTFELAMRTVKLLHELAEERKKKQQQQQQQQQNQQGQGQQGQQGQGQSGNSQSNGSGNSRSSQSGGGNQQQQQQNQQQASGGNQNGQEEDDDQDPSGGGQEEDDDLEDIDDDVFEDLSDAEDSDDMEDSSSALSEEWEDTLTGSAPTYVFPYSTEEDREIYVEGDSVDMKQYNKTLQDVNSKTTYIRPKMLSFFRGKRKSRTLHGTKSGRRLSSRKLSSILKADDPSRAKPFRKKVKTESKNSVVSFLIDESGSMRSYYQEAREILLTLSQTVGTLKIPHEVIGFTNNDKSAAKPEPHENYYDARRRLGKRFSRVDGCDWRIYRTFDEPFNVNSYKKMMKTNARGLTPIPDALDFAGKRIARRKEEQKIIFMVTDGQPEYQGVSWYSNDYLKMTENHVEMLKRNGIEAMFIGIGSYASYVKNYPNSLYIGSSDNFASKMAGFIFEQMKRIQTGR